MGSVSRHIVPRGVMRAAASIAPVIGYLLAVLVGIDCSRLPFGWRKCRIAAASPECFASIDAESLLQCAPQKQSHAVCGPPVFVVFLSVVRSAMEQRQRAQA